MQRVIPRGEAAHPAVWLPVDVNIYVVVRAKKVLVNISLENPFAEKL